MKRTTRTTWRLAMQLPCNMRALAMIYFPDSPTPRAAATRLRRWIVADRGLLNALLSAHWQSNHSVLTPRQVYVIVSIMGLP